MRLTPRLRSDPLGELTVLPRPRAPRRVLEKGEGVRKGIRRERGGEEQRKGGGRGIKGKGREGKERRKSGRRMRGGNGLSRIFTRATLC